jgi:hypothetical protein
MKNLRNRVEALLREAGPRCPRCGAVLTPASPPVGDTARVLTAPTDDELDEVERLMARWHELQTLARQRAPGPR